MFTTIDHDHNLGFNACKYKTKMKEEKIIKLISMFNENPMKCIIWLIEKGSGSSFTHFSVFVSN